MQQENLKKETKKAKPTITKELAAQEVYNVAKKFYLTLVVVMVMSVIGLFLATWIPFLSLLALTVILVTSAFMFNGINKLTKDLKQKYGTR